MNTRRDFIKMASAGLGAIHLPDILRPETPGPFARKKIVCVGAHPDDPESGCGGTLAKLSALGHEVTIVYLTTGEAGINGASHEEAARIRRQEAINACQVLNCKPVFAGQIDGDTIVSNATLQHLQELIGLENPDFVFCHWPVDSHKDHQCASLLTIQAWVRAPQRFMLYFFEVCSGEQTMGFHPTDFVDITDTQEQKRKAVYCHTSQDPAGIYACGHAAMEDFRGRELGVKAAEGFVMMTGKGRGIPGFF
ncbi:MAG TPA: PIG-L deacetylase family protein [Puia sp.]|uniref:PIG-L deacetylase family protein n=1 Tax=Puia sp. TaxID=2045100 RepID=UPI002BA140BA|nr:PIG-L deacetylase family protein [Puia sp.]HVU93581.1 PIG-L deacetylase family protein [Puia sp.]